MLRDITKPKLSDECCRPPHHTKHHDAKPKAHLDIRHSTILICKTAQKPNRKIYCSRDENYPLKYYIQSLNLCFVLLCCCVLHSAANLVTTFLSYQLFRTFTIQDKHIRIEPDYQIE